MVSKYIQVFGIIARAQLQEVMLNRATSSLFFLGKIVRLIFMLIFLWQLKSRAVIIGSYSSDQIMIFYLVYFMIDLLTQTLFRSVYSFTPKIKNGELDMMMVKPINLLVQSLLGGPDPIDALLLLIALPVSGFFLVSALSQISFLNQIIFLLLFINGMVLATALNILILAIGILVVEMDNLVWLYRDSSRLAQFPVSIYREPLKLILFLVIPFGVMITLPAEILTSHPLSLPLIIALSLGPIFLILSLKIWRWSLKRYSSVSK